MLSRLFKNNSINQSVMADGDNPVSEGNAHHEAAVNMLQTSELESVIDAALLGNFEVRPSGSDELSVKVSKLLDAYTAAQESVLGALVNASIGANEAAFSNAHVLMSSTKTSASAQTMSAAAEEMSASIAEIDTSVQAAHEVVADVSGISRTGRESSEKASGVMLTISDAIGSATEEVSALSEASEQIGEIVKSIEEIAQQTNLLALNATIEAARAGEAGKGFSVVASEVKALSNQTSQATDDIRARIEALRSKMSGIVQTISTGADAVAQGTEVVESLAQNMDAIDSAVIEVKTRMDSISGVLSQQSEAAQEISAGVVDVSQYASKTVRDVETSANSTDATVAQISTQLGKIAEMELPGKTLWLAKADHIIWKKRLADMFAGRESLRADELSDHMSCRLGRWYNQQSGTLAASEAFKAIEEPHRLVHKSGIDAVKFYNQGEVEKALACLSEVEKHSADVVGRLNDLIAVR